MIKGLIISAAIAAVAAPIVAAAHHSFAMFDMQRTIVLNGTVARFKWQNPHAFIEVDVALRNGGTERWAIEMNSPNNLVNEGWSRTKIGQGDRVTLYVYPLRTGAKGGNYKGIRLPDGSTLGQATI